MSKRKIFNLALQTFLLLSPLFYWGTFVVSWARGLFFIFASFALFGISLMLEPKRKFSNPWIALFLLWALIRVFIGGDFGTDAYGWFNFWISSAGFIYVFAGVLLFHTVYCHVENPKDYLKPILIVCILNFILVAAQLTGHDFMWKQAPSISGFFGISSQLGQYSAMSVPILLFINPVLVVFPLFTLIASKSVSPMLALVLSMAVFGVLRGHSKVLLGVLGICFIILAVCNRGYISAKWQVRPVTWEKTLKAALQKPYLGHGYRSFTETVVKPNAIDNLGGLEFSRPHQDLLHTIQELGFPAGIFIVGFFVGLWKRFIAKENKDKFIYLLATSILISLIIGMGQTQIRYAGIASLFFVLLSFLEIELRRE